MMINHLELMVIPEDIIHTVFNWLVLLAEKVVWDTTNWYSFLIIHTELFDWIMIVQHFEYNLIWILNSLNIIIIIT